MEVVPASACEQVTETCKDEKHNQRPNGISQCQQPIDDTSGCDGGLDSTHITAVSGSQVQNSNIAGVVHGGMKNITYNISVYTNDVSDYLTRLYEKQACEETNVAKGVNDEINDHPSTFGDDVTDTPNMKPRKSISLHDQSLGLEHSLVQFKAESRKEQQFSGNGTPQLEATTPTEAFQGKQDVRLKSSVKLSRNTSLPAGDVDLHCRTTLQPTAQSSQPERDSSQCPPRGRGDSVDLQANDIQAIRSCLQEEMSSAVESYEIRLAALEKQLKSVCKDASVSGLKNVDSSGKLEACIQKLTTLNPGEIDIVSSYIDDINLKLDCDLDIRKCCSVM